MMYDELIKNLRYDSASALQNCEFDFVHAWMLEAADAIEDLQKRKHGKWILVQDYSTEEIEDGEKYWVCSLCGCGSDSYDTTYHTNYCPNCGARMVSDNEE